ncbi:phage protein [Catenovulum agarivorans DS-2]|uniref:Phage protein n=1 Tax=Catenovulum agarivorans DS-2 TaxID=1328313 RepID=W7QAK5_9ALTE|nr:zinc ribbon domain-containing protein [Catenovulum agarivorans]EWH09844.1 phage protein [Catenovulum agarivorans DS-2]
MAVKVIECPECGKKNVAKAAECIKCGTVLNENTYQNRFKRNKQGNGVFAKLILGVCVLAVSVMAGFISNKIFSSNISFFSGEYQPLAEIVQMYLKDPSSYKHLETQIVELTEYKILVTLTYSATNSFGARLKSSAKATFNLNGTLIEYQESPFFCNLDLLDCQNNY